MRCLREASTADITLLYVEPGDENFGSILETGAALAAGKKVFLISPHEWPFLRNHPNVKTFATLEAAVSALMGKRRKPPKEL
jgi:hypothetical protein